ncbi:MAG: response regulator [Acidobacteriota bacterium]|nr:response regulator [Acidobacteriota bacterium]
MTDASASEVEELRRRLAESEATIQALLSGQIDAVFDGESATPVLLAEAQTALRDERDRAQRYLDTPDVMLLALDLEQRITLVNRYACSVLKAEASDLLGRDWIEICVPERQRVARREALVAHPPGIAVFEHLVLTTTGEERLIDWRSTVLRDDAGTAIGIFKSGADITDRRSLEAQFQQAQKLEAIGRLAGSVAHDFNNLLTVILGFCEIVIDDLPADDRHQEDLCEIQRAGLSATRLTRQLLAFSRKEIIEPKLLDLNTVVGDMPPMLSRLIGEDIEVRLDLRAEVAPVNADRGQIDQIVMNLAINARDAMPDGGTLTISTALVDLDAAGAASLALEPGPYAGLTVTDTGTGMPPEVRARLFEPFFTTKPVGKGTGLGLATVQGIAVRSGGTVTAESEVGKGTSFTVLLPRVDPGGLVDARPAAPRRPARHGAETVLVVEDEDALREVARKLLQRQGYTVLVASGADEAIAIFDSAVEVDVLLTDVVMPGGSGPALTKRLLERRPALKVVYMSGFTDDVIVHHGVLNPGISFLHKPFTSETLQDKIREALDR